MVAVLELALVVVVDIAVVFAMPIVYVSSPAPGYLGVAAESLAESVLLLSDHMPAIAVCSKSGFLALIFLAECVAERLVEPAYLLLVLVLALAEWLISECLVLRFLA